MILDLEDERIRVRLTRIKEGKLRLVIDYPNEPGYRRRVMDSLAEMLRAREEKPREP